MKYVLVVLGWMLMGYIVVCTTAAIHLIRAERRGFKALDWWDRNGSSIASVLKSSDGKASIMFGLLIWPERLIEFASTLPELYEMYERKS